MHLSGGGVGDLQDLAVDAVEVQRVRSGGEAVPQAVGGDAGPDRGPGGGIEPGPGVGVGHPLGRLEALVHGEHPVAVDEDGREVGDGAVAARDGNRPPGYAVGAEPVDAVGALDVHPGGGGDRVAGRPVGGGRPDRVQRPDGGDGDRRLGRVVGGAVGTASGCGPPAPGEHRRQDGGAPEAHRGA